jgi:hypothetical protein
MTTSDYYKYAALATASYVRMGSKGLDGLTFINEAASQQQQRLPTEQAQYFFDPANKYGATVWSIAAYYGADALQYAQDKSGFAATLFERTENGQTEKVLALRGTETRTCSPPTRTPASTTWSGPARSPSSTT